MTSYEKIKMLLADGEWHLISDWMQEGTGHFIGYKAPSRISEFMRKYPGEVETKQMGKFTAYRLKEKPEQVGLFKSLRNTPVRFFG